MTHRARPVTGQRGRTPRSSSAGVPSEPQPQPVPGPSTSDSFSGRGPFESSSCVSEPPALPSTSRGPQLRRNRNWASMSLDVGRSPSSTPQSSPFDEGNLKTEEDLKLSPQQMDRLKGNARGNVPGCRCFPPGHNPAKPGPYYTHLGHSENLQHLRSDVEKRMGLVGNALRFEKVIFTGEEGKTTSGCPLGKWVIRRSGPEEKVMMIVKHRKGHVCATAWIVVGIVAWEGVPSPLADDLYSTVTDKMRNSGVGSSRRCGLNKPRSCVCQGLDETTCGASFSFGCSWSYFNNGCKFARSQTVRKFKLSDRTEEQVIEEKMQNLATFLSPLFQNMAPDSFTNMIMHEEDASDCRLGLEPGRPWSGVTICLDYCAHAHRDINNMDNGCTTVLTLTKHRGFGKPDDEQLHVLPLYVLDESNESGSKEGFLEKVESGAIECLTKYPCEIKTRQTPLESCRKLAKKRKDERENAKRPLASKRARDGQTPPWNSSLNQETRTPGVEPQTFVTDFTNNEDSFLNPNVGGVAIALSHGAVLFEVARHELHATTALRNPNRIDPTRLSLVFYQHKSLNKPHHGSEEWKERQRCKKELAEKQAASATS